MKMTVAESTVKKWGNSLGIVISRKAAEELDLKEGENISLDILKKQKIDGFGICRGAKRFEREENNLDR